MNSHGLLRNTRSVAIALLVLTACSGGESSSGVTRPSLPRLALNVHAPLMRELFFDDETIEFRADVTDEFNEIVEAEIQWSSDLDGPLGSGNQFFIPLSSGLHSILTDAFVATTNGTVSLASLVNIAVIGDREANEALILGTGPLGSGSCPQPDIWSAFPRGSLITVIVPTTISEPKLDVIQANVDLVNEVTSGQITAELRILDSVAGPFAENSITIIEHDDPQSQGCASQFACARYQFNGDGSIRSSFVVVRVDQLPVVFAHEVGHAAYGLCHIDGNKIFARNSMMSAPTEQFFATSAAVPSKVDRNTITRFYSSSVDPGADRNAIRAAGLID